MLYARNTTSGKFSFQKKKLQEILVGFGEKQLGSISMWRFEMKVP